MGMNTYWISFANDEFGCLGCCIVDGFNEGHALKNAEDFGIHPGGEALCVNLTGIEGVEQDIARYGRNRIIPAPELRAKGGKRVNEIEPDVMSAIMSDERLSVVCEQHAPTKRIN